MRDRTRAARRAKLNRSELVRQAVRSHLRKLQIQELEERDRQGYAAHPASKEDADWVRAQAVWPPE